MSAAPVELLGLTGGDLAVEIAPRRGSESWSSASPCACLSTHENTRNSHD